MIGWLRKLRAPPRLPEAAWQATLAHYPFLAERPTADLERLRLLTATFLRDKEFSGAHGFVINDEVALAIAAQAVLPVLHLTGGLQWYEDFVGIVVQPCEVLAHRSRTDDAGVVHQYDEIIIGEAMERGPVMLSWRDVRASDASRAQGHNLVIHEFAHKIDMRSGAADACPPLPPGFLGQKNARQARNAWFAVLQPAYESLREQVIMAERFGGAPPWLDDYGAQSPVEFFAVACEAYFVNRTALAAEFAALVTLFDAFFKPPTSPTP